MVIELSGADGEHVVVEQRLNGATETQSIEATTSVIIADGDTADRYVGFGVGEKADFRFDDAGTDKAVAASVALRYHYDAHGRVVGRTLDPDGGTPASQYFVYDNDRIVQELDGNGNLVAEWVYGTYIDEVLAMYRDTDEQPGFETYYYIQDDLYNVVALTDDTGAVVERYTYGDYGAPTVWIEDDQNPGTWIENETTDNIPVSSVGNPHMFTGRRWDEVLALYDYRTRYYNPYLGRFLRKDTIGLWGDPNNLGNPYAYCGNNPWSRVDPYGQLSPENHMTVTIDALAGMRDEMGLTDEQYEDLLRGAVEGSIAPDIAIRWKIPKWVPIETVKSYYLLKRGLGWPGRKLRGAGEWIDDKADGVQNWVGGLFWEDYPRVRDGLEHWWEHTHTVTGERADGTLEVTPEITQYFPSAQRWLENMNKSHFGDRLWMHSMGTGNPNQIQSNIVRTTQRAFGRFEELVSSGNYYDAGFQLGVILHFLQDSHTPSHTTRDEAGRVTAFHGYEVQSPKLHAEADNPGRSSAQYENAVRQSRAMIGAFLNGNGAGIPGFYQLAPGPEAGTPGRYARPENIVSPIDLLEGNY